MALKKRTKAVDPAAADKLADKLADKPYGEKAPAKEEIQSLSRTTISLPTLLLQSLEDQALKNKRAGVEPKSVSAIVRQALDLHFQPKV